MLILGVMTRPSTGAIGDTPESLKSVVTPIPVYSERIGIIHQTAQTTPPGPPYYFLQAMVNGGTQSYALVFSSDLEYLKFQNFYRQNYEGKLVGPLVLPPPLPLTVIKGTHLKMSPKMPVIRVNTYEIQNELINRPR